MKRNAQEILKHYLVAALWTEEEEIGTFSVEEVSDESKKIALKIIHKFLKQAIHLLTEDWTDEQIGHDLWLTRGGHGAGFWDRDLPNGKAISDICDTMRFHGEVYEENGAVYVHEFL